MHDHTVDEAIAERVAQEGQMAEIGLLEVVRCLALDGNDPAVVGLDDQVDLTALGGRSSG